MAGFGNSSSEIALIIGVPKTTLERKYKADLEMGRAKAKVNIGRTAYEVGVGRDAEIKDGKVLRPALEPDSKVLLALCRYRLGWRDPPAQLEHTGRDGQPIETTNLDLGRLSTKEKETVLEILRKAGARPERAGSVSGEG